MEFMAWDLWDPSYHQVAQDICCYVQPGWQSDFYFGYGVDLLEENALNEKFCVQVLRILITKADAEIDELEKDLVTLQSELAWAEYEEWSEICCRSLREKINYLEISLKSLRNVDKHEIDVHLLMDREPTERLHEIVKALLQNHSPKKDKQPPDVIVEDSSSGDLEHASDLNVILKEELKELIITSSEKSPLSSSSLKFQEEKSNSLEAIKPAYNSVKNTPDYLQLVAGDSEQKKISYNNNSKPTSKTKTKRQGSQDNRMIRSSHLKPTKPFDVISKPSTSDALKHSVIISKPKKKQSASDLKKVRKEVKGTTINALILNSSLKPGGGTTGLVSKVKHTHAIKDFGAEGPAHATHNSHDTKKLCNLDSEVDGYKEGRKQCSSTKKSENLNSYLCCSESKGFIPKIEMRTNTIKESGTDAPAHASGNSHEKVKLCISDLEVDGDKEVRKQCSAKKLGENLSSPLCCSESEGYIPPENMHSFSQNEQPAIAPVKFSDGHGGKERGCESRSDAFEVAMNGSPNVEQKLSDIALALNLRAASPKDGVKACATNKIDLIQFFRTKRNTNDSQKVPETGITNNEHSGLTSNLELQGQREKDTFRPMSEEVAPQLLVLQEAEIAVSDNSNLNMFLKLQRQKAKRKIPSNLPSIQEASALPTGFGLDLPILKVKKPRKAEISYDNICLNQLFDRKIFKKPVQHDSKGRGVTAHINTNSTADSEKKSKKRLSEPILKDMNISDSCGGRVTTERASKEDISSSVDGSKGKTAAAAAIFSELSSMKVVDLKATAKQYKLQQYSKLKKDQLVKQLTDLLG